MDPSGRVEVALQTEQDRLKAELRQRLGSANVFRNEAPVRLIEAQEQSGRANRGCHDGSPDPALRRCGKPAVGDHPGADRRVLA